MKKGLNLFWNIVKRALAISFLFLLLLIILIFPPILDLWIENDSSSFFENVQFLYYFKIPGFIIIFLIALCVAIIWYTYNLYEKEKIKFEEQAEAQGKILLQKYEEIRDLSISRAINYTLKNFCNKHSFITAAQIYKYVEIPKGSNLNILVKYFNGYTKEQIDVNGIIQQYYYVSKTLHKDYKKGINTFIGDKEKEKVEYLLKFIETYTKKLFHKQVKNLDLQDGITYSYIIDSYNALARYYPHTPKPKLKSETIQKLEEINSKHRLGILRGIELDNPFMFQYKKGIGNEKEGRVYITNTITLEDRKHIILLTIEPDFLPDFGDNIREEFEKLLEEVVHLLYSVIEEVYNDIEEVV